MGSGSYLGCIRLACSGWGGCGENESELEVRGYPWTVLKDGGLSHTVSWRMMAFLPRLSLGRVAEFLDGASNLAAICVVSGEGLSIYRSRVCL